MNSLPKTFDLTGRTALVTGAAGLLGKQHSQALLEIGATVVLTDVNAAAIERVKAEFSFLYPNGKILAHTMDVTSLMSIQRVSEALKASGHSADILVNNAAIDPKVTTGGKNVLERSRLENFPLEQWDHQVAVGLTGAFLCSQVFGAEMAKRQRGVILNIASDLSVISPDQRIYRKPGLGEEQQPVKPVTYSVIKAGLIGLTRYLATYWASQGVRSNALSPGGVYQNQPEEFVHKLTNLIPVGRMAKLDEYHGAVQFLCSDASSYLNGQNIVMDGGRSVL